MPARWAWGVAPLPALWMTVFPLYPRVAFLCAPALMPSLNLHDLLQGPVSRHRLTRGLELQHVDLVGDTVSFITMGVPLSQEKLSLRFPQLPQPKCNVFLFLFFYIRSFQALP